MLDRSDAASQTCGRERMGSPITWFEILGADPEQTATFYSCSQPRNDTAVHRRRLARRAATTLRAPSLCSGIDYLLYYTDIHYAVGRRNCRKMDGQPGIIFYVESPDIQTLLDKAESRGGKTVMPVTEIPEMVVYASFTDPWGNRIGLMKGDGSGSHVSAGDNPPVDWVEIACSEPQKAWDFYRELFGWTVGGDMSSEGGGPVHGSIDTGSKLGARGGIGSSPDGKPRVDIYAAVDDLTKYLERAEGLGARIAMPAMKVDEHTEIAIFTDPQGTTFGLYASSN